MFTSKSRLIISRRFLQILEFTVCISEKLSGLTESMVGLLKIVSF